MKNLRFMFFVDCEEYSPDSEKKYWFDFMEEDTIDGIGQEDIIEVDLIHFYFLCKNFIFLNLQFVVPSSIKCL